MHFPQDKGKALSVSVMSTLKEINCILSSYCPTIPFCLSLFLSLLSPHAHFPLSSALPDTARIIIWVTDIYLENEWRTLYGQIIICKSAGDYWSLLRTVSHTGSEPTSHHAARRHIQPHTTRFMLLLTTPLHTTLSPKLAYLQRLQYTLTKAFCHSCCFATTASHIRTHTNEHVLHSFGCRLSISS